MTSRTEQRATERDIELVTQRPGLVTAARALTCLVLCAMSGVTASFAITGRDWLLLAVSCIAMAVGLLGMWREASMHTVDAYLRQRLGHYISASQRQQRFIDDVQAQIDTVSLENVELRRQLMRESVKDDR